MDITDLKTQIVIVLASVAVLWTLFKALKLAWRFTFICLVLLGLSFALPAIREWLFGFFKVS